jgi:nicotinate-nucleotide pyrophosphorylase (carboxylating)
MSLREIDEIILRALQEDVGIGDITTEATVASDRQASGAFLAKGRGVVSGTGAAARVFDLLPGGVSVSWLTGDGDRVEGGTVIGRISGSARAILTGERTALNILQRMSGIATMTAQLVEEVRGTGAVILDTRKTVPGLRVLDKMAVRDGGGRNHRIGLHDMILIKDNHIAAVGGIRPAIASARRFLDEREEHGLKIEVEARTLDEVREIAEHHVATGDPDRILLDNMVQIRPDGTIDTSILEQALQIVDGRFETEASGNVSKETAGAIASTGVDFISAGLLTHSVTALDISLEIALQPES